VVSYRFIPVGYAFFSARWVGGYNPAISRVIRADAVASALLAAGLLTKRHFACGTR